MQFQRTLAFIYPCRNNVIRMRKQDQETNSFDDLSTNQDENTNVLQDQEEY